MTLSFRDLARTALEAGWIATGTPERHIRGGASDTVILAYHNVVPEGESPAGDRSLHLTQRRFGEQLDRLADTHDVVALASLRLGDSRPARPRAVITFDDAYRGAVTVGFEELRRRGLPATVFVPPGLLGSAGFWWDRLAPRQRGLAPRIRQHALTALGGRGDAVLRWAAGEGLPCGRLPDHARPAGEAEVVAAVRTGNFSLGSHTWGHVNLAGVDADEAIDEITRGHRWLDSLPDDVPVVDWFAYPYGLSSSSVEAAASERVTAAVRVEGGAAQVRGRWIAQPHRLPRINVPAGLSARGLLLRLAGLL